jgi:cyclopropane fatty-acyl-phospholipid synthase-like methyltransferase
LLWPLKRREHSAAKQGTFLKVQYSEIYANTDVLSPIDRETWQVIAETCRISKSSRVIELASGKGAFARYLAEKFGCRVDGFDNDPEFVTYASKLATMKGLSSQLEFRCADINSLRVKPHVYDLGVCLGALYIFREAGWRVLTEAVKPEGYLAISDIYCKKVPAPGDVMDVFFEEEGQPLILQDLRRWYTERGFQILREEECSRRAWLEYYDLTRETLRNLAREHASDEAVQREITDAFKEDELIRRFGEVFVGYVTIIMKKA